MRIFPSRIWSECSVSAALALAAAMTVPATSAAADPPQSIPAVSAASGSNTGTSGGFPQETLAASQNGFTGKTVPPFTAVTVGGRKLSTSDRDGGKALIIELWGLNCASCLEEMAAIEPLYQEFRDRGLRIWSVNAEGIPAERIVSGLEKKGIKVSYDLLVDQDGSVTHLFTRWFIPVTVIVDRDGIVKYYKVGFNQKDVARIREKVGELVAD